MSSRRGYESIPSEENEGGAESSQLNNVDTSTSNKPFLQNIKEFNYRSYIQNHRLTIIASVVIGLFIVLFIGLATFLPSTQTKSSSYLAPISPGITFESLQQGLDKCRDIKNADSIQPDNKRREKNPRAPQDVKPILLKNAIVWDGQGEILNQVDILMTNGVISQVKPNIQAPKDTKIIDVLGHIVSPGIVDMHT